MSALIPPRITITIQPEPISPVNGNNWFVLTPDFSSTTANTSTALALIDLNILNQNTGAFNILETAGRFKIPIRNNGVCAYDPSKILKTFVTFPFDKGTNPYYVNESTGFGLPGPTISTTYLYGSSTITPFPSLAPDNESIVQYQLHYGIEYNPNVTFQAVGYTHYGGITVSRYASIGVNYFCSVGDIITISPDSGLYQYWAGTAAVIGISDTGFDTIIDTDQIPDTVTIFGGALITGSFTDVQHYTGTSSSLWAYNGVRQFQENNVSFTNQYIVAGSQAGLYNLGMIDLGHDLNNNVIFPSGGWVQPKSAIPIMPNQGERIRFFMDFDSNTGYRTLPQVYLAMGIQVYNNAGITGSFYSWNLGMTDSYTHQPYTQKCFTAQVFDNQNTIPIVDGYYYQVLIYYIRSGVGSLQYQMWYKGYNPCSYYNNVRVKFMNRQGSWSYWNFNKDSKQTTTIERTEYKRPLQYDYTINSNAASYQTSTLRGNTILGQNVNETFLLNSDWISEAQYVYLNQLVTSPEVYIFYDSYTDTGGNVFEAVNIPIIITDSDYKFKTLKRDKQFNLQINYKYAFDTKTQNQ